MPIDAPSPSGTGQGKIKRIDHLSLRLLKSLYGFKHGITSSATRQETFGNTASLFTGNHRFTCDDKLTSLGQYYIIQDMPVPMTILSLYPEVATYQ